MTPEQTRGLWNMLTQAWGQKFAEQYGAEPNDAWTAALAHLAPEAARHAYGRALVQSPTFPPTLPEFLGWAREYRPAQSTRALPAPIARPRARSTEELRQAASAEVAAFGTYADYERWRDANTVKGKFPAHPTPGSADWEYLARLAQLQALRGRPLDLIAAGAATGEPGATAAYERLDPNTGLPAHPGQALANISPERLEAISAEARRLQARGANPAELRKAVA